MDIESLLGQISRFPETPGVYQMKDADNNLLYIGKAVNLRSRVRSYFFDKHADRMQIPGMMRLLDHIDLIVTHTEAEALILEANLIRKHKPKYNIDLRDDKHYPYLKITVQEPFPRLLVVRRVEKDGAVYFGPYTDVKVMRRMAAFAKKIFRLRDCAKNLPLQKPIRPCINHSMKRCGGPCAGIISSDDYRRGIDDLIRFLKGKRNDLIAELEERMSRASAQLKFEDAALLRDQIKLIKDASRLQRVDLKLADTDCDVFGIVSSGREISLAILHFRDSLLMAARNFLFKRDRWDLSSESHDHIIPQFYMDEDTEIPREIIVPDNAGFSQATLQEWFDHHHQQNQQKSAQYHPQVIIPQKGTKRLLVLMAEKNAHSYLLQKAPPNANHDTEDLQKALNLPRIPEVIEAFDISNLGESFTVAGMVQFKNGLPNKSGYRRYKIKTVEGQNDFAMMMEAVTRRLRRLSDEGGAFPDLLLIDGGKGQLHAAMEALANFADPPMIASLAKKEEILFSPHLPEPLALPPAHPARKLVERIRDEVHRYAITYHRKLRGKQFTKSSLENLPGIGKVRAQLLLKRFGSVKRLREASVGEIAGVQGFSEESAERLKEALGGNSAD
ncbi:MAG: excinuclease ABC subunit UvrC [Chitinispirillia bacterium]|nr:excinuclease ABC subunit UvrC [Chitinispirillia bacterium]MCL2241191.1 excinuclease ABC subunit UvrC [Chitinispirillia bacterium]